MPITVKQLIKSTTIECAIYSDEDGEVYVMGIKPFSEVNVAGAFINFFDEVKAHTLS